MTNSDWCPDREALLKAYSEATLRVFAPDQRQQAQDALDRYMDHAAGCERCGKHPDHRADVA
jgi:hypothetical protein